MLKIKNKTKQSLPSQPNGSICPGRECVPGFALTISEESCNAWNICMCLRARFMKVNHLTNVLVTIYMECSCAT